MSARGRLADDRGETLIELVFAIMILGVLVVAVGSGIEVSAKVSGMHRQQSTAGAFLHNYAETKQSAYLSCPGATTYSGLVSNYLSGLVPPTGFNAPTATVSFWQANPGTFVSPGGCPASDPGLQQVTFQLTSTDGLVAESLAVVVRKP